MGALAYFIPAGFVRMELAMPMMATMIVGSYAGGHLDCAAATCGCAGYFWSWR